MNNYKVSIIIPCYNQAQYLDEALQSVFEQSYLDWECIIVNDGSLDNTEEVAQKWLAKDVRFKYVYKLNGGLSSARNLGLEKAAGDYIQFLDSDDFLDSRKIELSLQQCIQNLNEKSKIVISNFRMFTDDIGFSTDPFCELKQDYFTFQELLFGWDIKFNIPIHCGFFEASLFKNIHFSEDLKAKEDWIMWLQMFQKNVKCYFLDIPLVLYRTHSNSMTKDKLLMKDNHFKALLALKTIVPETEYSDYLISIIEQKNKNIASLEKHINNYKKSRGYKILEKVKKNNFTLFLIRILK